MSDDDLLLPPGTRLLHIGPQKTGTTSIQVAMANARDEMEAHGAYYPKGPYRRRKAGWALGLPGGPRVPMSHWDELVDEVRAAGDRRVCVSDENFARAERDVVEKIVSELGGAQAHVVAVARRFDRYLPSQWQERVKAGHAGSYESWLDQVFGDDPANRERWNVWQAHDISGLVDRWLEFVPPERFTLVIADESDRNQQPRVFEQLLGLPEGTLQPDPARSNPSLSWSELELLRALRPVYDANGWSRADYHLALRQIVKSLRARPETALGPRVPPMPEWTRERVTQLSDERVDLVTKLPVRVVGEPEWLRVPQTSDQVPASVEDLSLPVGLVAGALEGAVRAERIAAERGRGAASGEAGRRPVTEVPARELFRIAARRAIHRLARR